jgi:hypothetical protein
MHPRQTLSNGISNFLYKEIARLVHPADWLNPMSCT